jgi:hypothetical protein
MIHFYGCSAGTYCYTFACCLQVQCLLLRCMNLNLHVVNS